jgi:tetratricopeptide (TPR) repeat protein
MTVSLCLIVRDEEANLPECLRPVAGLANEVVIVDTGSADRTKEVAASFGARVVDFRWADNFAAARNECLRHATGDWIFWLDADDRIEPHQVEKFRALFAGLKDENAAYVMKCVCDGVPGAGPTVVDHIRLFRHRPDVRWEHRVHEQILPSLRRSGAAVRWADAAVRHVGYRDPALRRRKLERDLRLLEMERVDMNDHPFTLFNLGSVYQEMGRYEEAIPVLEKSLQKSHPRDSIVRKLFALLAHSLRALGRRKEAQGACADGLGHYPDDAELLFLAGVLRDEAGDLVGAEAALTRLLTSRPDPHFASVAAGLRGYKARGKLAEVLLKQGRAAEAESQWRAALREEPRSAACWLGLGQLLLGRGRHDEAVEAAARLEGLSGAEREGHALRARVLLARGEYGAAREVLAGLLQNDPKAVYPRVLLSHALLQEGTDLDAAEQALLEVLALDPDNAEATSNLAALRGRRQAARDQVFCEDVALAQLYRTACETPSEVNEHLPALCALARECRHVTDMGTGAGQAATAFLYARPEVLVCYDLRQYPEAERLGKLAGRTAFEPRREDVLLAEIEETDLLCLDTWHVYDQLRKELALHAGKVRKYIVVPGTTTWGDAGETAGDRGLWPAVEEFLAQGTFRLKERCTNNNGLAVLERVTPAEETARPGEERRAA